MQVGEVAQIAPGELRRVEVAGLQVCLVHAEDGNFYAIEDRCTHEDTPLSEGWVSGTEIECPMHNSIFDLRTGEPTALPATERATTYAVTVDGKYVSIEVPTTKSRRIRQMPGVNGVKIEPVTDPTSDWDVFDSRRGIKRMPRVPDRSELFDDEKDDWDSFQKRYQKVIDDKRDHPYRHRIAGGFFGLMCSPGLAHILVESGKKVMKQQGKPGSFTPSDHEFIDLVISFDSGHWGLLANHVCWAVASGIPIDTIIALRDGKEETLSEADRQVIAFIRAACAGTIDDEMWAGMKRRYGTERGVVEMLFMTLHLQMHLRLAQAFDEPQITPDELDDLLIRMREGRVRLPVPEYHGPKP